MDAPALSAAAPATAAPALPRGPVAYVNQFFPLLTETFVYREVLALQRLGVEVVPFALRRPPPGRLSEESRHLAAGCRYGIPFDWPWLVAGHAGFLARRPLRYLGTLAFVLTRRGESLRNRALTAVHFLLAVAMARDMRRRGVVHVHAHFAINAATIALVASRLLDIPFSFTAHNLLFTQPLLLREKIRAARFVAAISDYTRRYVVSLLPDEEVSARVHVVRCGLETGSFEPARRSPDGGAPLVLFVAQLAERKGVAFLVEACRLLHERGLSFRCRILGDGPQREAALARIRAHGLEQRVELGGPVFQEHLREHLAAADVFALPCVVAADGDVDGIPVALMEAMAMEVAVVSTTVSGIPELVADGVDGLLVAPRDARALAAALERLLLDPDLRARLGAAGRRKVRERFDVDRSAAQLAALFAHGAGGAR
jgi:glycosyltransferase involved in cell wall biosynthesis